MLKVTERRENKIHPDVYSNHPHNLNLYPVLEYLMKVDADNPFLLSLDKPRYSTQQQEDNHWEAFVMAISVDVRLESHSHGL